MFGIRRRRSLRSTLEDGFGSGAWLTASAGTMEFVEHFVDGERRIPVERLPEPLPGGLELVGDATDGIGRLPHADDRNLSARAVAEDVVMEQPVGAGLDRPNNLAIRVNDRVDPLG